MPLGDDEVLHTVAESHAVRGDLPRRELPGRDQEAAGGGAAQPEASRGQSGGERCGGDRLGRLPDTQGSHCERAESECGRVCAQQVRGRARHHLDSYKSVYL